MSGSGFRIGKLFGIQIRIDWSWLLIFALVSWSLAVSFGQAHQNWTLAGQWGVAVLASLLFFGSVLAHELAHSLVARARGVPIRNITLYLFGGVSNIQREPKSPFGELIITVVGPLVSLILGAFFLIMGAGYFSFSNITIANSGLLSQTGPVTTILLWLGSVNILVGLFNLIPGFPLDGGRIVRSLLWKLTNDLRKATQWASGLGQIVAWMIIFSGIAMLFGFQIPVLGAGFFNGIWLILIGWFLQNAAVNSYRRIVIQDILEDISVEQVMSTQVPTVAANISVENLIDNYIMKTDNRAFIVYDGDRSVGLVTIDDVSNVAPNARALTIVEDIMTPSEKLEVISPNEEASDAFYSLQEKNIRQLPVVTGNNAIVGLLRRKDIIRWLQFQSQTR